MSIHESTRDTADHTPAVDAAGTPTGAPSPQVWPTLQARDARPDGVGREGRGRREQVRGRVDGRHRPAGPGRERAAGDDVVPDGDLRTGARVHLVDAPRAEPGAVGPERRGEQPFRVGPGEQVEPGALVGGGEGDRHGPRASCARGPGVRAR